MCDYESAAPLWEDVCVTSLIHASSYHLKDEEKSCRAELKHLGFKEQVLKEKKRLLTQFSQHVSSIHSVQVCSPEGVRVVCH